MRNHSVAQYKELLEGDCLSQITLKSLGCLLHISSSCKVHGMLEQMTATTSHPMYYSSHHFQFKTTPNKISSNLVCHVLVSSLLGK